VDILDQQEINKEQQAKTEHLERLVEDLLARVVKAEDKANKADATATRSSRAKLAPEST
jgi:hypothetical protein